MHARGAGRWCTSPRPSSRATGCCPRAPARAPTAHDGPSDRELVLHRGRFGLYVPTQGRPPMIGILIAILLAALVYWLCVALGLPAIVGIVAALLVLISGIGTGGYGLRSGRRI